MALALSHRLRSWVELLEYKDKHGVEGRWVTYKDRPLFIPKAKQEQSLDDLHPGKAPPPKKIAYTDKDGKQRTRDDYGAEWEAKASAFKFARVAHLARDGEKIKKALVSQMEDESLPMAQRARAACLLLVKETGMRPGGSGMTDGKPTFGASNLQRQHVQIKDNLLTFDYRGKSGVQRHVEVRSKELARFVGGLLKKRGKGTDRLWPVGVSRSSLGEDMKQFGPHYKTKDFRTLMAMQTASKVIDDVVARPRDTSTKAKAAKAAKAIVTEISVAVSRKLGNTPAVARKSYLAPEVFEYALERAGLGGKL